MRYEIEIRKRAENDLISIQKSDAQRIADAIFQLKNGFIGYKKNVPFLSRVSSPGRKLADTFRSI